MKQFPTWAALLVFIYVLGVHPMYSQFGTDWTTNGFDAQRSSWVRGDPKISAVSLQTQPFQRVWKYQFGSKLKPPVLFDFYIGYRGFRSLGFMGSDSGRVFVIDTDLARMEWTKNFGLGSPPLETSFGCPDGMTTNVTRGTPIGLPPVFTSRGFGRRSPAMSGVGEPKEGAVTLKHWIKRPTAQPAANTKNTRERIVKMPWDRGNPQYVYTLAPDGFLHANYVSNGETDQKPVRFLAPNANAHGLIVIEDFAYVTTTNGCGGVQDGIWAVNLNSGKIIHWKADGELVGLVGPVFGPEGVLYVATRRGKSSSLTSLNYKTLKQTGHYTTSRDIGFTSSPLVIDHKQSDLLAIAGTDGRIHLLRGGALDENSLIGSSLIYSDGRHEPNTLSTWRDREGVVWVAALSSGSKTSGTSSPVTNGSVTSGALTAWKILEKSGRLHIEPGWVSQELSSALPPIIVNGVVFVVTSRESHDTSASTGAGNNQPQKTSGTVMHALDGTTGKTLWRSKDKIASSASGMAMSAGGGNVYLVTHDGTLHSFGFPMEH